MYVCVYKSLKMQRAQPKYTWIIQEKDTQQVKKEKREHKIYKARAIEKGVSKDLLKEGFKKIES